MIILDIVYIFYAILLHYEHKWSIILRIFRITRFQKLKYCAAGGKSYIGKILAKDNVITEQNIVNNGW